MRLPPFCSRLGAILAKEFIQMRRDRVTFAMMLLVPLIQLVLFGFAINTDPKALPSALVQLGHDQYSRSLTAALENSGYYRFVYRPQSAEEAEHLLARGDVSFVVTIPSDFGVKLLRGETSPLLVEADASDPAAASGAVGTLEKIAALALSNTTGMSVPDVVGGISIITHRRYNPEGITHYNIVPGLLGVILQMTLMMMTAMALTREIERGTMENLLAMPASPLEIMLGKVLPYLAVGAVQMVVILGAAKLMFHVPFQGSLGLLLISVLVFASALVILGYAFSTVSRTQMQAMQLTFFFFLPSLLLSGFMFPYRGMPPWAQTLGEFFPLTHFLRIVRAIMLKGAGPAAIADELVLLSVFVLAYAGIALLRFRRTLD